ncbi:hypothetical protein [Rhizobium leguminosarum]|uniref:hypothetical protein n=1 Tax=Rhizobium leguminosarum TaxID=384 RepID=UPI00041EBC2A|nr:hypothetical protein [Rhizobium leguminosarum]
MKTRVTFEVDRNELFDMLKKLNGDFSSLGVRLVEQLLQQETSFIDAIGMAVYGVSVASRDDVIAEEAAGGAA